ncbi:MAG: HhH-GPD-type base excision DNA repair protein [Antricoccus sp.]
MPNKTTRSLTLAQNPAADKVLNEDDFGLMVGMLLDQQFPMEHAFAGPAKILSRFNSLDPAQIAGANPEEFADLCSTPPAIHRYGRSMAGRIQALATVIVDQYDGDPATIWTTATGGKQLRDRLEALPGFGAQKSKIFIALLAKQLHVCPKGWEQASAPYSESGSRRSVADVVDKTSLDEVRAFKKQAKAEAKSKSPAKSKSTL